MAAAFYSVSLRYKGILGEVATWIHSFFPWTLDMLERLSICGLQMSAAIFS
jgi:hypothetical protein